MEIEEEREREKPPVVKPADHIRISKSLKELLNGISFNLASKDYFPIGHTFLKTKLKECLENQTIWSDSIIVTKGFLTVVNKEYALENFLRPPKWLVETKIKSNKYYVFLSAMEANEYLSFEEANNKIHILINRVKPFQDQPLFYPNISFKETSTLLSQFIIFSGSQYLRDEGEVQKYLEFIGIYLPPYSDIEKNLADKGLISQMGFIEEKDRKDVKKLWPQYKPSPFLEDPGYLICELCDLRNYGETPENAHYLRILSNLKRPEFENKIQKETDKN